MSEPNDCLHYPNSRDHDHPDIPLSLCFITAEHLVFLAFEYNYGLAEGTSQRDSIYT